MVKQVGFGLEELRLQTAIRTAMSSALLFVVEVRAT
jgi:hypothetical protein